MKVQGYGLKLKTLPKIAFFAFLVAVFSFSLLTFNVSGAHAEGTSLKLSPSVLQVKARAPADINTPLVIENLGDNSLTLQAQFRLFKAGSKADGKIEYLSDVDSDIFDYVKLLDDKLEVKELTLGPKQKKQLQLKISIPDKDISADYYFSLLFITKSAQPDSKIYSGQYSFSKINSGIAMNVLLSIKPKNLVDEAGKVNANIEEFTAPKLIENGPINFTLKVHNNNSQYISPKGTINITNMFNQTIGKVDIPSQNILANSSRLLTRSDSMQDSLLWQEKFLLGFYTARLNLELSDNGPAINKTIHFAAFPTKLTIGIAIGIILFLIIYKRVKEKMKQ